MYSGLALVKSEGPGWPKNPTTFFGEKSQAHLHMMQESVSLNVCDAN